MSRRYFFLTWCLAALLAVAAFRTTDAKTADGAIEFTRYPFLPELTVNEEPAVCERFLANMTEQFKSTSYSLTHQGGSQRFDIIPWEDRWNEADLAAIEVDVDGDGDLDLLLQIAESTYGPYFFSEIAIDDRDGFVANADSSDSWQALREQVSEFWKSGTQGPGGLSRLRVFFFDDGVYGFKPPYRRGDVKPHSIFRVRLDADWEEVCRVVIFPHTFIDPNGKIEPIGEMPDIIEPGMRRFLAPLRATLGFKECGGQMRYDERNKLATTAILRNIYFRPWTMLTQRPRTEEIGYSPGHALLEEWAHRGFWEARTYREILTAQDTAARDLSVWYEAQFGVPPHDARHIAERAVWGLVGGNFVVSQYFESEYYDARSTLPDWREGLQRLDSGETPAPFQLQTWFRRALTGGANPAAVARFLDAGVNPGEPVTDTSYILPRGEPPFFLAIDRPAILELLLQRGGDPNQTNHFGKTPLMYAAHFNLPRSAEILLRYGADPNLRTSVTHSCDFLRYTKRSALMYAAENADQRMMALLIEAGAETDVQDSGKRKLSDYLALNEELTDSERAAIIARWNLE